MEVRINNLPSNFKIIGPNEIEVFFDGSELNQGSIDLSVKMVVN